MFVLFGNDVRYEGLKRMLGDLMFRDIFMYILMDFMYYVMKKLVYNRCIGIFFLYWFEYKKKVLVYLLWISFFIMWYIGFIEMCVNIFLSIGFFDIFFSFLCLMLLLNDINMSLFKELLLDNWVWSFFVLFKVNWRLDGILFVKKRIKWLFVLLIFSIFWMVYEVLWMFVVLFMNDSFDILFSNIVLLFL